MNINIISVFALYLVFYLLLPASLTAQLKDKDGNVYTTVDINGKTWMTENLKVSRFKNGDIIPEAKTKEEWEKAGREKKPVWCYHVFTSGQTADLGNGNTLKSDEKNSYTIPGKLYNGWAVIDKRGLAPEGWSIPTYKDWFSVESWIEKDKNMKSFLNKDLYPESIKENGINCSKNRSYFRLPNGVFGELPCEGNWWEPESSELSFSFGVCTGQDGGLFAEYKDAWVKPKNWESFGFFVRCVKIKK